MGKQRKREKLPTIDEFSNAINSTKGNISNAAKLLGVSRITVMRWSDEFEEFAQAIKNSRKELLDKCISTAQVVAFGIPKIDEMGKITGWVEKPDPHMLRYFMSTLGRDEGFGENLDITTKGNEINSGATYDFSKLSPEDRAALLKLGEKVICEETK